MPGKRPHYLALAVVLTAVFVTFLLAVNAHYLFHSALYEDSDLAANSLSVLRAEHFHELYGQYSRWGFHHPGPAVMYTFALGELLFYKTFHLVPTPYNAQVIMLIVLVCGFLAGGICVAARWVRSPVFVPLAVLLAALHFTAADPHSWVLYAWMPFVMVMLFFGLLMSAASVGAGQGDDLPLLALSCGFMIHTHVAQPLFVGPIFLLAYAGLAWACRRPVAVATQPENGNDATPPVRALAPWRVYPWAHRFVAVLAFVFVLPILVDLCLGSRSNAARILLHLRTHQGHRQPWLDALYCFVRFGVYKPSRFDSQTSPGHVTTGQIGEFVRGHPEMTALWLGALLVPLLALAYRWWAKTHAAARAPAVESAVPAAVAPPPPGRWRFLGWLAAIWLLAAGLTVVWGHIEDGEMFYFNSWFTYAVYFVLALLAAGAISDIVETATARRRRPRLWTALAVALCLLATAGFLSRRLGAYHEKVYDNAASRAAARTVDAVLAARPGTPRTKLLVFEHDQWPAAVAVALRLTREGWRCVSPPNWNILFGDELAPAGLVSTWAANTTGELPMDVWHVVPANVIHPLQAAQYPLLYGCALLPGLPAIDPSVPDATITFMGQPHNSGTFVLAGWSESEGGTSPAWSTGPSGLIAFAPRPVPVDTAVEVDFHFSYPYIVPGKRDSQRLGLRFNGHALGTLRVEAADQPQVVKTSIPAAIWNERPAAAVMALDFLDAISPRDAGESNDTRALAFATDRITFLLVPATAATTRR